MPESIEMNACTKLHHDIGAILLREGYPAPKPPRKGLLRISPGAELRVVRGAGFRLSAFVARFVYLEELALAGSDTPLMSLHTGDNRPRNGSYIARSSYIFSPTGALSVTRGATAVQNQLSGYPVSVGTGQKLQAMVDTLKQSTRAFGLVRTITH